MILAAQPVEADTMPVELRPLIFQVMFRVVVVRMTNMLPIVSTASGRSKRRGAKKRVVPGCSCPCLCFLAHDFPNKQRGKVFVATKRHMVVVILVLLALFLERCLQQWAMTLGPTMAFGHKVIKLLQHIHTICFALVLAHLV